MDLEEAKAKIEYALPELARSPFVLMHTFERNGRPLHLAITERFRRACHKGKVWQSKPFLTAIKNAEYGFDPDLARSKGGRDGIFLLDRDFEPRNVMMRKLFNQYIDKPESGLKVIADKLGADATKLQAARLVSHHMRLLGVLWRTPNTDWLVLVDYDDTR